MANLVSFHTASTPNFALIWANRMELANLLRRGSARKAMDTKCPRFIGDRRLYTIDSLAFILNYPNATAMFLSQSQFAQVFQLDCSDYMQY
jgi:hypothetical protein